MEVDDRWVVGDAPLRVCTSDVEVRLDWGLSDRIPWGR